MASILELQEVTKEFGKNNSTLQILKGVNLQVEEGDAVSIIGPSGSGKSTLLSICAGLDKSSEGSVLLCGQAMETMSVNEKAKLRNDKVGFIFQNFQLFPNLSALENVLIPSEIGGNADKEYAKELLDAVGLANRYDHVPAHLSGGEQQRVAIARAFVTKPQIIFADEPTGNLDGSTSEQVEKMLFELNKNSGTALVLITHDEDLARRCNKVFKLQDGKLIQL